MVTIANAIAYAGLLSVVGNHVLCVGMIGSYDGFASVCTPEIRLFIKSVHHDSVIRMPTFA